MRPLRLLVALALLVGCQSPVSAPAPAARGLGSFPFTIHHRGVTVTGTSGATLVTGQTVTGSAVRDIVIANDLAKVNYVARTPDVQRGAHMLQLPNAAGTFVDAMEIDQADWSYYAITVGATADSATVIEATDDLVRVAFKWTAFSLTSYAGGGVPYRDDAQGLNYAQGAVNPNWKVITSTVLTKTIAMNRTDPGYFVGWHSSPRVGPPNSLVSAAEDTTYGERELGLGGGSAVAWSSSGNTARWPAWADDVDHKWTNAGLSGASNKIWWPGIKDPTYAPYNSAAWISTQPAGYPATQASGPFYVADLHYDTTGKPFAKILASRIAREIGGWKVGTYGGPVSHFNNEDHTGAGVPYEHQVFIGGAYWPANSANAFAAEPSTELRSAMAAIATGLDWPTN